MIKMKFIINIVMLLIGLICFLYQFWVLVFYHLNRRADGSINESFAYFEFGAQLASLVIILLFIIYNFRKINEKTDTY